MEVSSYLCRDTLRKLKIHLAGSHGPISEQDIHDGMCSGFCMTSDILHEQAMNVSRCSCSQLSLSPMDLGYTGEGSWCSRNSGQILCNELELCGVSVCHVDDFSCRRREYDLKFTHLKGYGNECSSSYMLKHSSSLIIFSFAIVYFFVFT